jgi:hypothetical protein
MTGEPFSSDSYQNVPDLPGKKSQLPRVEQGDEGAAAVVSAFYEALLAEDLGWRSAAPCGSGTRDRDSGVWVESRP